jgi:hypothetical protein
MTSLSRYTESMARGATAPAHRQMLEGAIAAIDEQIAALESRSLTAAS